MFYLKDIQLKNFRCYDDYSVSFGETINIIVGNNAIGKTSLLESVCFLGLCKSFKTNSDSDMIRNGENYFYIKGTLENKEKEFKIVAALTEKGKSINVNDNVYKKISDYYGFLNIVYFSPNDLAIVKGDPKGKRQFLDTNIGQIDHTYLKDVINYKKVLKERNELLKNFNRFNKSMDLLKVYNLELIKIGKDIIKRRKKFIKDIEPFVNKKIKDISKSEEIKVVYKPNVDNSEFEKELFGAIERDLALKTTTVGPHRDDIVFNLNGVDAGTYGSQGQQRTIALAIKLGLADYLKENGYNLIILLDDVFGELDFNRQAELLNVVKSETQVLITTTTIDNVNEDIIKQSNIIKIEEKVI